MIEGAKSVCFKMLQIILHLCEWCLLKAFLHRSYLAQSVVSKPSPNVEPNIMEIPKSG